VPTDSVTLSAMANARAPFDARAWGAFGACGAIWGSTFLVISIGNDALAPVWAATLRLVLASLLLTGWTLARGQRLPRGPALRAALGYGVAQFGINLPLLYWGERTVPSGLAAVIYATLPLSSALMARAFGMERLTLAKVTGAVVAFGGVAVLFSSTLRAHVPLVGLMVILLGATAASLGSVWLKRGPRQDPFAANAVGCAIGALIVGPISLALGEPHVLPTALATAWPVLYLTVAGSLGAYVIMAWLVHAWPVTRTSYVTVIVPVIALTLGAVVRHERLGATTIFGAVVVLAGLLIGMRPERPGPRQGVR
jgi:drug/metabolite transporter (DMT)-like permease